LIGIKFILSNWSYTIINDLKKGVNKMTPTTLQLEKLTCPSCMQKITTTVDNMDGVNRTKILFDASKARVYFDEAIVSTKEIIDKIEEIGYSAEEIK